MTSLLNKSERTGDHFERDDCLQRHLHLEQVASVRRNLMPEETAQRSAALFTVLSDPTRLRVLYALLHTPGGELCVCDLASGLGRDDTTISHQLRVLRNQQVVATRKTGRVVYYRLIDEHVRMLLKVGMMHSSELSSLNEREVSA